MNFSFSPLHFIDDDLETAKNVLRPEQFPNLDDDRVRLIHKILYIIKFKLELREVSRSLTIVSETVQEGNQLTSSH